jgi:hypothetical protein
MITQRFDQDLAASVELSPENAMRPMSVVEWPSAVLDTRAEVLGRVLVFEALDPAPVYPREEEPNHGVGEAPVDEIVDDRS